MKDILKIMRLDLLTAMGQEYEPSSYILAVFMLILLIGIPLFYFPAGTFMYLFMAGPLIVPLQGVAEKSGLSKLYGILPVRRRNITRARFLYIFLTHFAMEAAATLVLVISVNVKLFGILPGAAALMEGGEDFYTSEGLPKTTGMILIWFAFLCFTYAFMEMYGQIHGRQNEMKVLFIMIAAVCVIILGGVFILSNLGYPEIKLDMPVWAALLTVNTAMLGICVLFGEITASKLAKREL